MITKNDWDDALDAWVAEERERLGGPPTPEEVVAYLRGELAPNEAARIRTLLVYYPELTPLLNERLDEPRSLRKSLAPRLFAAAAMLAVATLTTLLIQERQRNMLPSAHSSHHELSALRVRGSEVAIELPAGEERYLLTVVPSEPPSEDEYQIEIVHESEVLWSASGIRPIDDIFDITVPGRFLKPGTYTLNVYALGGVQPQLADRYTFRVVPSR